MHKGFGRPYTLQDWCPAPTRCSRPLQTKTQSGFVDLALARDSANGDIAACPWSASGSEARGPDRPCREDPVSRLQPAPEPGRGWKAKSPKPRSPLATGIRGCAPRLVPASKSNPCATPKQMLSDTEGKSICGRCRAPGSLNVREEKRGALLSRVHEQRTQAFGAFRRLAIGHLLALDAEGGPRHCG
jgi:hypothetical protein